MITFNNYSTIYRASNNTKGQTPRYKVDWKYLKIKVTMEGDQESLRLRKQTLRPIQTKSRKKDGEEMNEEEPVSPVGLFFNEPKFNVHIVAILGFGSKADPDFVKDNLTHTLLKHPRFSSLLVIK